MTAQDIENISKFLACVALMVGVALFFIWMERRRLTEQLRHAIRWYAQGDKRLGCQEVLRVLMVTKLNHTYLLPHEKIMVERMQSEYKFGMDHK